MQYYDYHALFSLPGLSLSLKSSILRYSSTQHLYSFIFEAFCFLMHKERKRENSQKIIGGKKKKKKIDKNGWPVKKKLVKNFCR